MPLSAGARRLCPPLRCRGRATLTLSLPAPKPPAEGTSARWGSDGNFRVLGWWQEVGPRATLPAEPPHPWYTLHIGLKQHKFEDKIITNFKATTRGFKPQVWGSSEQRHRACTPEGHLVLLPPASWPLHRLLSLLGMLLPSFLPQFTHAHSALAQVIPCPPRTPPPRDPASPLLPRQEAHESRKQIVVVLAQSTRGLSHRRRSVVWSELSTNEWPGLKRKEGVCSRHWRQQGSCLEA